MNMSWQHYLENNKPIFLACIPEQVYDGILKSSKNNDLFQNHQTYFRRIYETSLAWFL